MTWRARPAEPPDFNPLTDLWHDGWHAAHADHVPPELTAIRTRPHFAARLSAFGDSLRTAGDIGAPLGFCVIHGEELDQLFVADRAKGTGLAQLLMKDAERRLAGSGVERAFLLCVAENARAMRFYTQRGWENVGLRTESVVGDGAPFSLQVARFEKTLRPDGSES